MFFLFSKILYFISSPIIWIFILLGFSVFSKNQKTKRICLITSLIAFYFFGNTFLLTQIASRWEIPIIKVETGKKYEAAIILGGASQFDKELERIQFISSGDRVFQAIDLFKTGVVKKIVFSGGSGRLVEKEIKEAIYIKDYLIRIGIPDTVIIIEANSQNTYENALFTKKTLDEKNINGEFLLITSAIHMRRSIACFEKQGIKTTPYSTDKITRKDDYYFDAIFIPRVETFVFWERFIHEILGYYTYKLMNYI